MSLVAAYLYPRATILKIVDGDTFDAEVDVGFRMYGTFRLRLYEYEAPEVVGLEAKMGRIASAALARLCPIGSVVTIYSFAEDSFGRWLVRVVTADGIDVVQNLVHVGYGKIRSGRGVRPTFDATTYPPS